MAALHQALSQEDVFIVRAYEPEPKTYLLTNTGGHHTVKQALELFQDVLVRPTAEREQLQSGPAYLASIQDAWVKRLEEAGLLGDTVSNIILEYDAKKNKIGNLQAIKTGITDFVPRVPSPKGIRDTTKTPDVKSFQGMLWMPPKAKEGN